MERAPSNFARDHTAVALAILAFTLVGFFVFPGHTWLASDTQIYVPMLERLYDPAVLTRDLINSQLHLGWTAYDEIALLLRRATSLPFLQVLTAEQIVFRLLALWGVYLIATSIGLSRRFAVMVAGVYSLGATVAGPAVMTVEYEAVPRGFALGLILLAIGLTCHERTRWAAAAASLAMLFHPPTTIPFWLVFAFLMIRSREWRPLIAPLIGAAVLVILWRLQAGGVESQAIFGTIGDAWEQILRVRSSYLWVSMWPGRVFGEYGLLWLIATGAVLRLWNQLGDRQKAFCLALPAMGLLSVPVSYLLLETLKWRIAPQLQPARQVLWVTLLAVVLSVIAGVVAAQRRRYPEAFAWMLPVFLIPVRGDFLAPISWQRAALIAALAALAVASVRLGAAILPTAVVLAAMFAIPNLGAVRNYPDLHTPGMEALCVWGASTPPDAMFLFPDAGRYLYPGVFRAEARRALYVDAKAGGQGNFFESLAFEWMRRWQSAMTGRPDLARYRSLGIDYIIVSPKHALEGITPVYQNGEFVAYRVH